ncbi:hypothetical protein DFJ74DRAFT_684766 [Hyaloraphidium curvatum]|nr:hypothetical protein DFJ74DRAFT_684766 [Hyaloraphidium curvatum]
MFSVAGTPVRTWSGQSPSNAGLQVPLRRPRSVSPGAHRWEDLVPMAAEYHRRNSLAADREGDREFDRDGGERPASDPGAGPLSSLLRPMVPRPPGPPPAPAIAGCSPTELLFSSIANYFEHAHVLVPLVHRPSFEDALRGRPTPYSPPGGSPRKPLALFYALAASGSRWLPLGTEVERQRFGRWCCDRARDALQGPGAWDGLEGAQASALLVSIMMIAGAAGSAAPLVRASAASCEASFAQLPPGGPGTPEDWVTREIVVRTRIVIASYVQALAYYAGRDAGPQYFSPGSVLLLPCSDAYFDHRDPRAAFERLAWTSGPREVSLAPGWAAAASANRTLASQGFEAGSVMCLLLLNLHSRSLLLPLLRAHASGTAVADPQAAKYDCVSLSCICAPPDPPPGLLTSPDTAFAHPGHAKAALQYLLCSECHAVEALLAGGFVSSACARAARVAAALESLLASDPEGTFAHAALLPGAFKVGNLMLAQFKELDDLHAPPLEAPAAAEERRRRRSEMARAAGTVMRFLEALAGGYGLQSGCSAWMVYVASS